MATCKDCLHVDVCRRYTNDLAKLHGIPLKLEEVEHLLECDDCEDFKNRAQFVELPCKIGSELYRIKKINGRPFVTNTRLNVNNFWKIVIQGEFGKTVFLTREEAEQALKESKENPGG